MQVLSGRAPRASKLLWSPQEFLGVSGVAREQKQGEQNKQPYSTLSVTALLRRLIGTVCAGRES